MKKRKLKMDKRSKYQRDLYARKKGGAKPSQQPSVRWELCRYCGKKANHDAIVMGDGVINQERFCESCNSTWTDSYEYKRSVKTLRYE